MNYLAHLLLSGPEPDWRLGGLLGDFVKGPLKGERPEAIEAGIRLHRKIDAVVDQHPAYRAALAELGPEWRRYGGIALDIWFDHLLSKNWSRWSGEPLGQFCDQCWEDFRQRRDHIPPNAQRFMARAEQYRLLQGYTELAVIERSLARVGQRLRRPVSLEETMPALVAADEKLVPLFDALFLELSRRASEFRRQFDQP